MRDRDLFYVDGPTGELRFEADIRVWSLRSGGVMITAPDLPEGVRVDRRARWWMTVVETGQQRLIDINVLRQIAGLPEVARTTRSYHALLSKWEMWTWRRRIARRHGREAVGRYTADVHLD